jgi:crotonobetainyl-CoA:carnitine CoA-transferase CaiB-like acyl-CoA transferase
LDVSSQSGGATDGAPLDGVRILDLTRLLPGGFATAILADFGAEVIKIEQPGIGDQTRSRTPRLGGTSAQYWVIGRNKRSIAVDLKNERGRDLFLRLSEKADVIIESFRPGVVDRLGISYDVVREVNPKLVYCSLTGYGQTGPLAARAGHDLNYVGRSGILSITGTDEKPVVPGVQIADLGGGAMMVLAGVLAALVKAQVSGRGDYVDVSMTDGAFAWLSIHLGVFFATGDVPGPGSMPLNGMFPCYNVYRCADGRWITVAALEEEFWNVLCAAVGESELVRTQFDPDAIGLWSEVFSRRSSGDWLDLLEQSDACVGPVNTFAEAISDPQIQARAMTVELAADDGMHTQVASPIRFQHGRPPVRTRAPNLGADTFQYLRELGLSDLEIEALHDADVVSQAEDPRPG